VAHAVEFFGRHLALDGDYKAFLVTTGSDWMAMVKSPLKQKKMV